MLELTVGPRWPRTAFLQLRYGNADSGPSLPSLLNQNLCEQPKTLLFTHVPQGYWKAHRR